MWIFTLSAVRPLWANSGKIIGWVFDAETGDGIIGANVYLENTTIGAATDLDGMFFISNIPPGQYNLIVQMIGYNQLKVEKLRVEAGESQKLELTLHPQALKSDEVVVEARLLKNNEASLLKARQKALTISDAISAEAISRNGSANAAEAMNAVTGASVVGGKYLLIRGLGDRYSGAMLNGAQLPSSDPDRKAVQMDLFPANLLENIVTIKTFTPDKPAEFSGGMVNVATRSYPERLTIRFSTGTSLYLSSAFSSDYLTIPYVSRNWLGFPQFYLPSELAGSPDIPNYIQSRRDKNLAQKLDRLSKVFSPVMSPQNNNLPVNQNYNFSIGNQTRLWNMPVGYLASITYGRSYKMYEDGRVGRWRLYSNVNDAEHLTNEYFWNDQKGEEEIRGGGLFTLNFKPAAPHEFTSNLLYTRSGISEARYISGSFPRDLDEDQIYETRALKYTERELFNFQQMGEHHLRIFGKSKLKWLFSYTRSSQNEPDFRFFTDHYSVEEGEYGKDTTYSIAVNLYPRPSRYFRSLKERANNFKLDYSIPARFWGEISGSFQIGGAFNKKRRNFREYIFRYRSIAAKYNGNPIEFFGEQAGIIAEDTSKNIYTFGNVIVDESEARGNYDGELGIQAYYGMLEVPLSHSLKFVGGVRYEHTKVSVLSQDPNQDEGKLQNVSWLPSANLIYALGDAANLRLAYSQTIARPTLREMAPYVSQDFVNDYFFIGNPNLKLTEIRNFDFRMEWFTRPGEIMALSIFAKKFKNPIERVILTDNGSVQYKNVNNAQLAGMELEVRKQLDFISQKLDAFQFGGNLTLIQSRVKIPLSELQAIRVLDPDADDSRELQGQSPYLLNLDFSYKNSGWGTFIGMHYNVFGKRLASVNFGASPAVYEMPRHSLNLSIKQPLHKNLSLKIGIKNLLNAKYREIQEFKGREYIVREYSYGRSLSLGIGYSY
ncbi:MAG: TonB-dependent receptor [Calditrichia bacterium]